MPRRVSLITKDALVAWLRRRPDGWYRIENLAVKLKATEDRIRSLLRAAVRDKEIQSRRVTVRGNVRHTEYNGQPVKQPKNAGIRPLSTWLDPLRAQPVTQGAAGNMRIHRLDRTDYPSEATP